MKYSDEFIKYGFSHKVPMLLDDFEQLGINKRRYSSNNFFQWQFNDKTFQDNYLTFKNTVFAAVNNQYLPIYRMADGEFLFLKCMSRPHLGMIDHLKKVLLNIKKLFRPIKPYGREIKRDIFKNIVNVFDPYYFQVMHNESYSRKELETLKIKYINDIKVISNSGLLAMHYVDYINNEQTNDIDFVINNKEYLNQLYYSLEWFKQNGITINAYNYTSFYYIYALLTGKDENIFLKGKNILIITNIDDVKRSNINKYLRSKGSSNVQFYNISPTGSMFEMINWERIDRPDLILVGAGIGSSNILAQCEQFNTVCIDAGIVLEAFSNPNILGTRLFLTSS